MTMSPHAIAGVSKIINAAIIRAFIAPTPNATKIGSMGEVSSVRCIFRRRYWMGGWSRSLDYCEERPLNSPPG